MCILSVVGSLDEKAAGVIPGGRGQSPRHRLVTVQTNTPIIKLSPLTSPATRAASAIPSLFPSASMEELSLLRGALSP